MPWSWPWLDAEYYGLRASLRESEPFFSVDPIRAVKVLTHQKVDDYIPVRPGHWWTARCRAAGYQKALDRPPPKHRRVPDVDCTCGFYSFREDTMTDLDWAWGEYEWRVGTGLLSGLWNVELAGLVIEHERGYRSERLRLVSRLEPGDPLDVLHELGQSTTGQIRRACGFYSGNQSSHIRSVLKAAARRGECIEVKTPMPNNHGGHLWVSLRSKAVGL